MDMLSEQHPLADSSQPDVQWQTHLNFVIHKCGEQPRRCATLRSFQDPNCNDLDSGSVLLITISLQIW